jgi:hypothetical protein
MAGSKYSKYIVYDSKPNRYNPNEGRTDAPPPDSMQDVMYIDEEYPKGAFFTSSGWHMKSYPHLISGRRHVHDFDEIVQLIGADPNNPKELGGEVEFWLEDEKFIITKSCAIFIPKGMKHCPMIIKRVDKPFFSSLFALAGKYERTLA